MFNCAPHFDYKTTFTPRLNQAYLVDFQSYYVRICSYTVDPFLIFEKGSPEGNLIGVQTRTFSESKEQKKVCKSTTYTLFEQLRTVLSGEGGIRTPGTFRYVGFQDRCNKPGSATSPYLMTMSDPLAGCKGKTLFLKKKALSKKNILPVAGPISAGA